MSSAHRTTLRQLWWAPIVCYGVAWALSLTKIGQQQEWKTLDWRTEFRALWQPPPDPRIAVVLFEDDTDSNLVPWPPDRQWHGNFNEFIAVEKPAVVAWDVILDASREGEGDAKMAAGTKAAIDSGSQVIVAVSTRSDPIEIKPGPDGPTKPITNIEGDLAGLHTDRFALIPFPELRAVALWGFADAPRSSDGIIRDVPLLVRYNEQVFPSLALQTLLAYYKVTADQVRVRLGDAIELPAKERTVRIPISANGTYFVNYRYDQREIEQTIPPDPAAGPDSKPQVQRVTMPDFPVFTYRHVLLYINAYHVEKKPHAPKPPNLAGKIVFVGQTVTGKADAGPTPRNPYSPLVYVYANIVNNILAGDLACRVPDWAIWAAALALGYGGLWLLADRSVVILCSGAVLGFVGYGSLAVWSWVWKSWWFPMTGPLIGFGALQFIVIGRRILQEQRQKQEIKNMFGSYLAPVLVERMIKSGQLPQLGGHEEEITAYFSDVQGFSSFSEKLPPDRLVALMNEYLTACTDIIQEEGGTLDKYIGDAVVAIFGAPVSQTDHAFRACVAALRVQARIGELRSKWEGEGDAWPEIVWRLRARIGLNTGRCIVGNMGSRSRFSYTMMGDDVNLAARMESGAKSWGAYTMVTEATRRACELHGDNRIVFRPLGKIVVKGRAQATPIHEIVGLKEVVSAQTHECLGLFAQGMEKYYARDWVGALECFRRSGRHEPHQSGALGVSGNPSTVYVEIVEHLRAEPPPEGWDGVYVMKEK